MGRGEGSSIAPYSQKLEDASGENLIPTVKSYNNQAFLLSPQGRLIRILCEFEEPASRLHRHHIRSTVLVFGSARAMTAEEHKRTVENHKDSLSKAENDAVKAKYEKELERLSKTHWMCEWVEKIHELSRKIAEFSVAQKELINASFTHMPDYFRPSFTEVSQDSTAMPFEHSLRDLVVTTGGGPGFMEAANKGAASVEGVETMGMGISLPFEKGLNPFITRGLAFEFHYFFTRKFWMMYSCRAIIIAPGGFGTMDEMFELLTLRQTKKIPSIPIVLFGVKFWKTVINWQAIVDFGTVSQDDVDSLCFADTVDEALDFIVKFFTSQAEKS